MITTEASSTTMSWATAMMASARKRLGSRSGRGSGSVWSGRSRVEVMAFSVSWKVRDPIGPAPGPADVLTWKGSGLGGSDGLQSESEYLVPLRLYGTKIPFVNRGGRDSVGPKSKLPGGCDESNGAAERPLRADAQRNRARILEAAEAVFAAEGIEVPVDMIAEKAGVGVGTLYRHFPTKERLCEAILLERLCRPHG